MVHTSERPPQRCRFYRLLLHYAVEAGNIIDATEFCEISDKVPAPIREKVMTIADMLRKHGWEQGLAAGIEQGIEKGIEKGIEQGALTKNRENAINMLKLGSDVEFV